MTNETKQCKYCQTEIPKKAKVCPNCRKKQNGIVKWVVLAVVVLAVIGAAVGGKGDDEPQKVDNSVSSGNLDTQEAEEGQGTAQDEAGDQETGDGAGTQETEDGAESQEAGGNAFWNRGNGGVERRSRHIDKL